MSSGELEYLFRVSSFWSWFLSSYEHKVPFSRQVKQPLSIFVHWKVSQYADATEKRMLVLLLSTCDILYMVYDYAFALHHYDRGGKVVQAGCAVVQADSVVLWTSSSVLR